MRLLTFTVLFLSFLTLSSVHANEFKGSASVYFWLPTLSMNGNIPPPEDDPTQPDIPFDISEFVDNIDLIFMGSFEVNYNKYLFFTDIVILNMSDVRTVSILNQSRDVALGFEGWQSSYYGGYSYIDSSDFRLDFIGGIRYFSLKVDLEVDRERTNNKERVFYDALLDGVVGIKGQYNINKNYFIPYYMDVGMGGSDLTYQLQAGVGYAGEWGDIIYSYRHLVWDIGDDDILNQFILSGSSIAYRYNF